MAKVEMYSMYMCPFCIRAKALLEGKGVDVVDIPATGSEKRAEMNKRSGRNTFPQVFINGKHVGGSDELAALERSGKLDQLLAA
ncbi:glutaredoxin 3 [Robiginitomaculum antarcticum]|uniref:glutaredoxin 3 n=1 Tax=Robiginitomaculum antarcticum TaxID=437507 RepID=UPI00047741C5|nr:glutaredoxin 3 [Robiginitomaculum antarcticum]